MSARHRKPCPACGRSAHAGMSLERIVAALVNGGFTVLTFVLRVPEGQKPTTMG